MLEAAIACLALNIYHEARSEPVQGRIAVAHVTLNRAKHRLDNVCKEVFKSKQFSWTINPPEVRDLKAFNEAKRLAYLALRTQDVTNGATHYHADYVSPAWSYKLAFVKRIGSHLFYKG